VHDALRQLKQRQESDQKRFMKHYGIDIFDRSHYDLVLDTTRLTPEQVVAAILKRLGHSTKIRLNPKNSF